MEIFFSAPPPVFLPRRFCLPLRSEVQEGCGKSPSKLYTYPSSWRLRLNLSFQKLGTFLNIYYAISLCFFFGGGGSRQGFSVAFGGVPELALVQTGLEPTEIRLLLHPKLERTETCFPVSLFPWQTPVQMVSDACTDISNAWIIWNYSRMSASCLCGRIWLNTCFWLAIQE